MVLDFDLNYPPLVEGSSASVPDLGNFGFPINADFVDDDIQLLNSPPPSFQCRRQPRKIHHPVANLEALSGGLPIEQGSVVAESADVLLSFNGAHNDARIALYQPPTNPMLFNAGGHRIEFQDTMDYVMPAPPMPPPLSPPMPDLTYKCPVCLDVISNPCSTACGHIFCEECIEASIKASVRLKKGRICPNCRTKLPARKSYHRVYLPNIN